MRRKVHHLKCWPHEFEAMKGGLKRFEYRKDDRDYQVGDVLILEKWIPVKEYENQRSERLVKGEYTGEKLNVSVSYVLRGGKFGVPEGYVVMSVEKILYIAKGENYYSEKEG